ncbi:MULTISPECIES: hypothetical protein [Vibrio]|uniref:Cthe-2314-like HEPN domain-containing protein n=1 Tax=Vibrio paracholerae TaxID=650003 RepID=A0ABD7FYJ5_9VIBR|nr:MULTISPECIES: hypothetical protein [Vibrio]EJT3867123.1 hypothetical protein [Vibrio cholerae]EKF9220018.1 hypothetical protein [Vibrio cholerae]QXC57691.1 hypothetical protein KSS82_06220 [Vibrio mimicus]RBM48933.1 hypothetical protein DLR65_10695 [Vibrio tarriae]RBM71006.1 hypothetical protein DLR72_04585 [Vibrio paracholerae]
MEKLLKLFGYSKRKRSEYAQIQYKQPISPEENTEEFRKLVADGNHWIRQRTTETNEQIGRFLSIVLLLEHKLDLLLNSFDVDIVDKTFGVKIDTFKDFIKAYNFENSSERREYRKLIPPLHEIRLARNKLAHDIQVSSFPPSQFPQMHAYVKKTSPEKLDLLTEFEDEEDKATLILVNFCFIASIEIARLRLTIKQ